LFIVEFIKILLKYIIFYRTIGFKIVVERYLNIKGGNKRNDERGHSGFCFGKYFDSFDRICSTDSQNEAEESALGNLMLMRNVLK
jgi:hypothetical protein